MESPAAKAAICIVPIALLVAVLLAQTISAEIASIDARNAIELPAKRHQDPQIVITASVKGAKAAGSELRLPRTVVPRFYDVTLLPILEEGNFTTSGRVDILIDCLESTNNITLHAVDIAIDFSSISVVDVATNQHVGIARIIEDPERQFLVLVSDVADVFDVGRQYQLSIQFMSFLKDDLRGFYRTSFVQNGQTKYVAASQMQPTDARRAFPCFDEPNMKANFSMRLGRRETQLSTSNMPLMSTTAIDGMPGFVWDQFETSLPMSTYLVAMLVADFTYLESPPELSSTRFRIWSRPDAIRQAEYASQIGPRTLEFFEDYFQIPFPLPKQDMAALPDLSFGGMENWGLITYRETALLFDPLVSSRADKQRVASVVAHELAHQWFGDLVTLDWWSDLWLNEGFASYMEYLGVDYIEPSFGIVEQFVVEDLQNVFGVDALESSHPISVVVNDPEEINELFDRISYGKGASVIRMLNKFLGDDTFRMGLTAYLNSRKYGNAVQEDLWRALTQQAITDNVPLPVDVETIMKTWTLVMGYPVVTVLRDYDTGSAVLIQSRFLLNTVTNSSDTTLYSWWIPLSYTVGFNLPTTSAWMAYNQSMMNIQLTAESDQWVIFNVNQNGYYRVNYDPTNWNLIRDQLLADHSQISIINRAQIMDDSLNIARANLLSYQYPLELSTYLVKEFDYIPWQASLEAFSYIDLMFVRTGGYGNFKRYMASLITPLYNYVTFNEAADDSHLLIYTRARALSWACKLGVGDCVSSSINLYRAWMDDPSNATIISPNYKKSIACTAVTAGGEPEWNFAYQQYSSTNVAAERTILLSALSCTSEAWVLSRLLEWSLDDTKIRRSDAATVFKDVGSSSVGRYLAFDFLRNRWTEMVAYFPTLYDLARIVDAICTGFNTQLEVAELMQLQADHGDELGTAVRAVTQAIERTRANVNWMALHYNEVLEWLQQH